MPPKQLLGGFGRGTIMGALLGLMLSCVFASGHGQAAKNVPYDSTYGPGFNVARPSYVYPESFEGIDGVDFKDLRVRIYYDSGASVEAGQLRKGKYQHRDAHCISEVTLEGVHFMASDGEDGRFAIVFFNWFAACGSSSDNDIAEVFEFADRRLKLVQQVDWDRHAASGKSYSFNDKTGRLVVRSAHHLPGEAHCCASAIDVVTFRWIDNRFVRAGMHTELSEEAIRAGKSLPK